MHNCSRDVLLFQFSKQLRAETMATILNRSDDAGDSRPRITIRDRIGFQIDVVILWLAEPR